MSGIEYHPLANIFPLIEGKDFDDLVEDVRASGLREKIVLLEDKILDGRNRYRAAVAAGIIDGNATIDDVRQAGLYPRFRLFVSDEGDPLKFVLSRNLHRRHLTDDQRRMIAAELVTLSQGRPAAPEKTSQIANISREGAAEMLTTDIAGVDRARNVKARGAPELVEAVKRGDVSVSRATEIAKLSPDEQRELISRADPDIVREVAKTIRGGDINGARSIMASRQEPDDSLDYFPTPPYATRALLECVLPHMGVGTVHQVWEPACGEGHMTGVIEEYAKGTVIGTDIFDYSQDGRMPPGWWKTLDFLDGEADLTPVVDWIISNPPFDDKTERFVLRALDLAEVGVAMFVRLQWLETVGRYEAIFRDRPPTLIAFFCERVNLCKGRWDPDGSTATAYIWLVWMRDRLPLAPFWIPPGCRKNLSRDTDRDRFTAHPVQPWIRPEAPPCEPDSVPPDAAEAAPCLSPAHPGEGAASPKPFDEGPDLPAILDRRGLLAPAQRQALASAFPPANDEVKPCP